MVYVIEWTLWNMYSFDTTGQYDYIDYFNTFVTKLPLNWGLFE